eukprot:1484-Pelagomonas_calceolata.AAC.1
MFQEAMTMCSWTYKGYKGKRPQSRRLPASLFINTHKIMKEKRKFVVILDPGNSHGEWYLDRAFCGRHEDVEKISCTQKARHTSDGESRPGD